MPRNSSGTYTTPVNTVDPAVTATTISSADFNALTADLTTEMTDSFDRSGKGAMLADMAMGGFKITNVGAPVATTDAARKSDLTLGGDVTGTLGTNLVSKVNGTTVSGTTGSNNVVFSGSPTIATPLLTGLTTGATPATGNIGEVVTSTVSSFSIANGVTTNVTSISITAGNWLVFGGIAATGSGGTVLKQVSTAISNQSANFAGLFGGTRSDNPGSTSANVSWYCPAGSASVLVTVTTTIYLLGFISANPAVSATVAGTLNALRVS